MKCLSGTEYALLKKQMQYTENNLFEYKSLGTAYGQEEELLNILIDSSLYQDMNPEEKETLLNYLISSYFN
jgi:hypothetical protein